MIYKKIVIMIMDSLLMASIKLIISLILHALIRNLVISKFLGIGLLPIVKRDFTFMRLIVDLVILQIFRGGIFGEEMTL